MAAELAAELAAWMALLSDEMTVVWMDALSDES
jgi:hypothetical protein